MKNGYAILFFFVLNAAFAQKNPKQLIALAPADATCTNPPGCIENATLDDVGTPSTDDWLAAKSSWYTSHGSPTPGASSVWLWSYGGGGEGMYTCFNFESGKQYKLCITIRTDNPPGSLGYENQDAIFYIQASNGDFFSSFPTGPDNQVIAAWHAIDQVETAYTFAFTANSNYNKLWLFPYMLVHAPTPVDQYSMNTFDVKVEEVHAPTVTVSGTTVTVANSPNGGHWDWTPANLVTNSNANGTVISVMAPCNATTITGNFVADCAICTNYTLQANIDAPSQPTMILGSNFVCEGSMIQLSVASAISAVRTYQWMQLVNSQPVALSNNDTFSGVTSPILTITTTTDLDSNQFYCAITTLPENCTFNSQTVAIYVSQNPPVPMVTATNPTNGGANGSILITSPIANAIWYQLNDFDFQFSPLFENLPAGVYEVSAVNGNGCRSTIQVILTEPSGIIPKGISPNDDGNNDSFDLTGIGNISQVKIFNRYGVNVYSKSQYLNEWKGQTDKGKSLPTATYYYIIFFENGEAKTGWVYLQREI